MSRPLPAELNHPAWLHGHSAFTTVRTRQGEPLLWERHLARLESTCALLGLPAPDPALPPLDPLPWGLLRLTVTEQGQFWSHRPLVPEPVPYTGLSVYLSGVQVHPHLGQHKTGNYLPYRLAAREAAAHGAQEALLQDAGGAWVDGSRSGLLLHSGGQWWVPAGGLPSVTRAAWLDELGVQAEAVNVTLEVVQNMEHLWLCGAGLGVAPVGRLSGPALNRTLRAEWPATHHPALRCLGAPG
ncbi:aminotransferase class IV [Deinococcus sonorensis]|uniref:Aminotransferase class IV n=2 Tax=Deinococcus sonorensis TaxID=309891 RepID=A0AAU7U9W7_9DEIO